MRIFNTYGPRMRPNDGRAVPTFVRQALEGKPLTVFGDGSQTRSFCYVDDLIRGLVAARRVRRASPVNIGNPTEFTLNELAETVLARHRLEERDRLRGAAGRRPAGAPAGHHTRAAALGWEPEIQLEEGLRRMLSRSDGSRSLRRRIGVAAAIVLGAAGLGVPAAPAKAHMLVGIQDDAMTLYGNPTSTFPTLSSSARRSCAST